jgi:surface antigen
MRVGWCLGIIGFTFGVALAGCAAPAGSSQAGDPLYRPLDGSDVALAVKTQQQALERSLSHEVTDWRNEHTGRSGSVEPLRTFKIASGAWCREFEEQVRFAAETWRLVRTACRDGGGEWQLVR